MANHSTTEACLVGLVGVQPGFEAVRTAQASGLFITAEALGTDRNVGHAQGLLEASKPESRGYSHITCHPAIGELASCQPGTGEGSQMQASLLPQTQPGSCLRQEARGIRLLDQSTVGAGHVRLSPACTWVAAPLLPAFC